jgi:hypothetical protein
VAVYLTGSAAQGGWVRDRSDIDAIAISSEPLSDAAKSRLVAPLRQRALPCPARGLELVVYARDAVRAPGSAIAFEINLNTGPTMEERCSFAPSEEPRHWFVIDLAIARAHAVALFGPPAAQVIGPLARADVLAALISSIDWQRDHEPAGANAVLNTCRGWRWAVEGVWSPKGEAGRWAIARGEDPEVIGAALAWRGGEDWDLGRAAAASFIDRARTAIDASDRRDGSPGPRGARRGGPGRR